MADNNGVGNFEPNENENNENNENQGSNEENENNNANQEGNGSTPGQEEEAGVEVAAGDEEGEQEGLFLGDHITIPWRGGKTSGTIYYIDEAVIRIRPDGAPTTLVDFPLSDGTFDEDLGVTADEIEFTPGPRKLFVDQEGFRIGQVLDAYKGGTRVGEFIVLEVNAKENKLHVQEGEDRDRYITFSDSGIDLSEPFDILMVQPMSVEDRALDPEAAAAEAATDAAVREVQETRSGDAAIAFGADFFTGEFQDVELPVFVQVKKKLAKNMVFSELEQKGDMLNELLNMFDYAQQQNPLNLKRIRTLVEMMSGLKQSILKFDSNGNLQGEQTITLHTFQDLLKNRVPIARPVLGSKRVLVTEDKDGVEDTSMEGIHVMHLNTFREESVEFIDKLGDIPVSDELVGPPRWFQMLISYFNKYPMGDEYGRQGFQFKEDGEFFRAQPPGYKPLPGFANGSDEDGDIRPDAYNGENPTDYVVDIDMSLRRAHGPTVYGLPKGGTEIWKSGDKAPLHGHVIFPYKSVAKGVVGALRTGQLWSIIVRSLETKSYMQELINSFGTIQSLKDEADAIIEPDVQKPIYVTPADTALLEIPFSEYLNTVLQALVPRGPGDLLAMKHDLGILEAEPDDAQLAMIQQRVQLVIANLVQMIQQLNDRVLEGHDRPTVQPIVEDAAQPMLDALTPYTYLTDVVKQMFSRTPGYKGVDIAIIASLFAYSQDFTLAVLGKNREGILREYTKANTKYFLGQLTNAKLFEQLMKERGAPPEPVICPQQHPIQLEEIRRKKDHTLRMKAMAIFVARYKGGIEGNWVDCQFCDNHLICKHELIQIQQFLNPAQQLSLQKEIVLNFAGGTFGVNYICKQCGQPIGELGFDTSIEYDDEGRPMMGRSVLTDKEQEQVDELNSLFDVPVEKQDELKFSSPLKTEAYKIIKVFMDRIGIVPDGPRLLTLIDTAASEFQLQLDEQKYNATKTEKQVKFHIFKAYVQITIVMALLLLDIQTRTPDYPVQFFITGCKPGFGGWPLLEDANLENAEETIGLLYMECALRGIDTNTYPWNEIRTHGKAETRQANIHKNVIDQIQRQLQRAEVQAKLEAKRRYIRQTFGEGAATGKHSELIPDGFLPRMETATEAAENAASKPTVAEGAHGAYGQLVVADTWIRAANKVARSYILENGLFIQGSPFTELGCCYGNAQVPGEFFKSAALPPEPKFRPIAPGYYKQTVFMGPLTPRGLQVIDVKADMSLAYRVYLKLCFRGPHVGQPHEFGYDYTCDWCGLKVPKSVLIPDRDKDGNPIYGVKVEELVNDMTHQGVEFSEEAFQALLDRERLLLSFERYQTKPPTENVLATLAKVTHPPSDTWREAIRQVFEALSALKADPSDPEIAAPLNILRTSIQKDTILSLVKILAEEVRAGKKTTIRQYFDNLVAESRENPQLFFNIMRTYFLVPAQRIVEGFQKEDLYVPPHYKLQPEHVNDLETMLNTHVEYCDTYRFFDKVAKRKLRYVVKILHDCITAGQELNVIRISGLEYKTKLALIGELLKDIMFGALGFLADASQTTIPESADEDEDEDEEEEDEEEDDEVLDHTELHNFVANQFRLYANERLSYNMERVREEIALAKEKEKNYFISVFDPLTADERLLEKFFKNQKIKSARHNWALGSSKLRYDDVYLANQEMLGKIYSKALEAGDGIPEDFVGDDIPQLPDGLMGGEDMYEGDGYMGIGDRGCGDADD